MKVDWSNLFCGETVLATSNAVKKWREGWKVKLNEQEKKKEEKKKKELSKVEFLAAGEACKAKF